jgi:hypothetical protein
MVESFTPIIPDILKQVDVSRLRFGLVFLSSCTVEPADFLNFRRLLQMSDGCQGDRQEDGTPGAREALFRPPVSTDPVARRKFQKPAPAFVLQIPIDASKTFQAGDQLGLDVLFVGNGIPLSQLFLRQLIHIGERGLVNGEGCFDVATVHALGTPADDDAQLLTWQQNQPLSALYSAIIPLNWLLSDHPAPAQRTLRFQTPARLLVRGKPLRTPGFRQLFPFMLRRVTSMLHAHAGVDLLDDPGPLREKADRLVTLSTDLSWHDWRPITGDRRQRIGGFLGEVTIAGPELADLDWILATAALLGIGKGAAYGAGHFEIA